MNDLYWRIFHSRNSGKITIVCMQWFDEYDYDESRFLTDEDGHRYKFDDEDEAIAWLNKNVKEEHIDPEYLQPSRSHWKKFLK